MPTAIAASGDRSPRREKHFIAIDRNGTAHTVHPRDIEFVVPGGGFTPQKIDPFWQTVTPLLDPSSLEVAWEFVAEEGAAVTVEALADLLFSETSATARYATYCLLSQDKLYFKRKGDQY
ncbi:MAG: RNB domain-containing ribonuclease, partial [Oscillatoriales cyanobacterium SM2_1_8]|nr:RNB domain-containing ribonuclease [Oscillatoriales cyanobacterium SM2_1_8]